VRLTVRRGARSATSAFGTGRPAAGELAAYGLRALDTVGARLGLIFLATSLVGILLATSPGSLALGRMVLAGVAMAGCAAGLTVVLVDRWPARWIPVLAAAAAVTTALLASGPPGISWDHSHTMAAWVVAGMSGGVAASRGPAWGLVVFVPAVATSLAVEQAHGHPAAAFIFLGSLTYYVGGAVTNVLARRGFATTERALEAVEAAETEQRVTEERWRARREADRLLHDTVLATLSVLAHEGLGVAPGEIRAACARDIAILTGTGGHDRRGTGNGSGTGAPAGGGDPGDSGTGAGPGGGREAGHGRAGDHASSVTIGQVAQTAVAHAAALGLELAAHLGALERQGEQDLRLDPLVAAALGDALAECIANVRLHAGVSRLDLIASVTRGAVVLLLVDEGRGFDPAAVPEDRLGLRASVQERLSGLGGSVAVWSRPDRGTSVKIRVPLPAAVP
jgi:signal transduction histidine kinase